jgi:hypothetical protein
VNLASSTSDSNVISGLAKSAFSHAFTGVILLQPDIKDAIATAHKDIL